MKSHNLYTIIRSYVQIHKYTKYLDYGIKKYKNKEWVKKNWTQIDNFLNKIQATFAQNLIDYCKEHVFSFKGKQ